jgi:outer membrane protein assembly factor BamA
LQTNLSHSIFFPRIISPFHFKKQDTWFNDRTIFNINGAYTIRNSIYDVKSLNTSMGYEWSTRIKNQQYNWLLTIPNLERTLLKAKDSLYTLQKEIPSLKYAFNDGFVVSIIAGVNTAWTKRNHFSYFKFRVEQSGAILGMIKSLDENDLFRFIKTDIEFKHFINYRTAGWAFRTFGGFGYDYGRIGDQPEYKLPFFKAYFAGGPYSMRAWPVRQLGPGSSILYDTTSSGSTDRFGNMQLEGNVEYRFNLTTIAGIKLKSALFIDIGNIWGVEFSDSNATVRIPEASFNFSRLGKDIAIGGGISLRFDFDFFLIRLDWAYKLKNPRYADINNGWFYDLRIFNGNFQLGIGYPF